MIKKQVFHSTETYMLAVMISLLRVGGGLHSGRLKTFFWKIVSVIGLKQWDPKATVLWKLKFCETCRGALLENIVG